MAGSDRMVRHLPEWVLRQYRYVQTILRPPIDIELLAVDDVAQSFTEFALHVLSHQQRGHPVPDNQSWAHTKGYMRWFIRVSHPIVNPHAPIPHYELMPLLVLSLLTRRLLLSSSGPDILPTHTRSSAASGPEWTVQWGILMCFVIQRRLCAWCSAYSLSGACWSRCRLHGGVGVHGMDQYDLCSFFYDILLDLVVITLHLRLLAFFMTLFVILFRCFIPLFFVI